jgi:hypothetical protein
MQADCLAKAANIGQTLNFTSRLMIEFERLTLPLTVRAGSNPALRGQQISQVPA